MAKVYKFRNRDGTVPMTDQEVLLITAYRQAPREVQRRVLELAKKAQKPEPGRS